MAANRPVFRLPPDHSDRVPTTAGLTVAPKSPASARKANMAVPPLGQAWEERLMAPGQRMPTLKPQTAHPARPSTGQGERAASR